MRGLVPVAQYLRMSSDQQQYSLLNQAAVVSRYAELKNFTIVKTYEDPGRSGLVLRERPGLQALLSDVVKQDVSYKAILVYDVSRWGRFQDSDEAAAYEFVCKSAGIPVHYCAEQFTNDQSISSSIMKALKRAMAAEYSRELGVKCYDGQKRLVQLGFKMGGSAGYGLRRMMLSPDGKPVTILKRGEYKALSTNRMVLVHGPKSEVATVQRIYRMATSGMRPSEIVRQLNRSGPKYSDNRLWKQWMVEKILKHPKYAGCYVWGQTSLKMHTKSVRLPPSEWITIPGALKPIVSRAMFDAVQRIRVNRTENRSDSSILRSIKRLLRDKGCLSQEIIDKSRRVPGLSTIYKRFGSLQRVYELVGFRQWDEYFERRRRAAQTEQLHCKLVDEIVGLFPSSITSVHNPPKRRRLLLVDKHILVSVYLCRSITWPNGRPCWKHDPVKDEKHNVTLLCTLASNNEEVENYYVFPSLGRTGNYKFGPRCKWLAGAIKLKSLNDLYDAIIHASQIRLKKSEKFASR